MAHLIADPTAQLSMFPESDLVSSIIYNLGAKEITGKEKMDLQEEITRQEETKKKVKNWLSWYDKN